MARLSACAATSACLLVLSSLPSACVIMSLWLRNRVRLMEAQPDEVQPAIDMCMGFAAQIAHPAEQVAMQLAGGTEAITAAMRRWPENLTLQQMCNHGACAMSLWYEPSNRALFRAGLTRLQLETVRRWGLSEPEIGGFYGAVGCLMDFIAEHRAEFAEQGGIELYVEIAYKWQNITDPEIQQSIWDAFSTFCAEPNQARCVKAGVIDLYIDTMRKHPFTGRVRQEVMQSSRGLASGGREYRERLLQAGFGLELVKTIRENPTRRAEMSVGCGNVYSILAEDDNSTHRAWFVEAGALEAMIGALRLDESTFLTKSETGRDGMTDSVYEMHYNVHRDCLAGLARVVEHEPGYQAAIVQMGIIDVTVDSIRSSPQPLVHEAGCALLKVLAETNATQRALVESAGPPAHCQLG